MLVACVVCRDDFTVPPTTGFFFQRRMLLTQQGEDSCLGSPFPGKIVVGKNFRAYVLFMWKFPFRDHSGSQQEVVALNANWSRRFGRVPAGFFYSTICFLPSASCPLLLCSLSCRINVPGSPYKHLRRVSSVTTCTASKRLVPHSCQIKKIKYSMFCANMF